MDITPFLAGPIDRLGERLVSYAYTLGTERGPTSICSLLRSGHDPQAIKLLRTRLRQHVITPLAAVLGGDDAELRAELICAQLVGCLLYILAQTVEGRPIDLDRLIAYYAPAVQACITPSATRRHSRRRGRC